MGVETGLKLMLDESQIQQFINDGFVRIDGAFSPEVAAECRSILWHDIGFAPEQAGGAHQPVIRLGDYAQEPFRQAANTPVLHSAFDQLVGKGRWIPRTSLGSFVVRFPSDADPGDTGWHVDASFPPDEPSESYSNWRVNIVSRGRALLMLFLFSDTGRDDAPTRIRIGSHLDVARILAPAAQRGMAFLELGGHLNTTSQRPEALATGEAGTVYLCHPFLVHAGQPHHGREPRFLAQPPLYPRDSVQLVREDANYSPLEQAIRMALIVT
jgi:hypothetical protein